MPFGLIRIAVALAVTFLAPIATGYLLRLLTLGWRVPADEGERARRMLGFRSAAPLLGWAQIILAYLVGALAVGPELVSSPHTAVTLVSMGVFALVAFVAGGIGRVAEIDGAGWPERRDAALLRLRLVPLFVGPALLAIPMRHIPLVDTTGAAPALVGWAVALRLGLLMLSVAFASIVAMRLFRAVVPAPAAIATMTRELAAAEGTPLAATLWLPTGTARLANAAALPWARTIVVTERLRDITSAEGLRAIIAHEVGHLSEPVWAWGVRLVVATLAAFLWAEGLRLMHVFAPSAAVIAGIALGVYFGRKAYHRLSRRLELRADARARALTSPDALAEGLEALRRDACVPLSTATSTHPTFHERLRACGRTLPPPVVVASAGGLLGPVFALGLVLLPIAVSRATSLEGATDVSEAQARMRTLVAAWDPAGHRALEAIRRRAGDEARARAHARDAERAERSALEAVEPSTH